VEFSIIQARISPPTFTDFEHKIGLVEVVELVEDPLLHKVLPNNK
jgi:hypothetical protein